MDTYKPTLRDFRLVKTYVDSTQKDFNLKDQASAFTFFALDVVLGLQDDEIRDAVTDTSYLSGHNDRMKRGHDRGIDALHIDYDQKPPKIHFLNCKYSDQYNKSEVFFPGKEIDKIASFLFSLLHQKDNDLKGSISPILYSKVQEIWRIYKKDNPTYVFHICANSSNSFEPSEKKRFENRLKELGVTIQYDLMPNFVNVLLKQGKQQVDARFLATPKSFFEKSDGDIRALIICMDVRDLLRIVIDNQDMRNEPSPDNYSFLQKCAILEDAFDDNVRISLEDRTPINRDIRDTAKSNNNRRFFYYNNGITITCHHFEYPPEKSNPIVLLENLQIVNGSQTVHALYDAFCAVPKKFKNVEILCRIYETKNEGLSLSIAEKTNSQNPVTSRDIRANDPYQRRLGKELEKLGYYYERKNRQFKGKPRNKRIDSEKAGQALMALYCNLPAEAKDRKKQIFATYYAAVFPDIRSADEIILAYKLYNAIERRKLTRKAEIINKPRLYNRESFILHATYYIMYVLSGFAGAKSIEKTSKNFDSLMKYYDKAIKMLRKAISAEKRKSKSLESKYSHRTFFISNRPKEYIDKAIGWRPED